MAWSAISFISISRPRRKNPLPQIIAFGLGFSSLVATASAAYPEKTGMKIPPIRATARREVTASWDMGR